MNKAEWDALDEVARNQVVWDHFPEITPSSDDWVLSTDDGKTGFDFFDTEVEANCAIPQYAGCQFYENATVVHWRHCLPFTTDRNACALVLDEINQRDKAWVYLRNVMEVLLDGDHGLNFEESGGLDALFAIHVVDPDTICYCAVKAAKEDS